MREGSGHDMWWIANWPRWARRCWGHICVSIGSVTFGIKYPTGGHQKWQRGCGRPKRLRFWKMHQPDGDGSQKNKTKKTSLIPGKRKKSLLNFPLIAIIGPWSQVLCFGSKLVCKFPDWMQMPSYLEIDPRFCFSILLQLHLSCTLHWACRWLLLCGGVVVKYSLNNNMVSLRPGRHVECMLLF